MWTKSQLWQSSLRIGGIVLLLLTIFLVYEFGLSVLFISIPFAIFGYFVNRMYQKTLAITREQAEQMRRHVDELSQNIDEQDRLASVLKKSEEQFRNSFDYASIGMALVSSGGDFLKVNFSLQTMLGFL